MTFAKPLVAALCSFAFQYASSQPSQELQFRNSQFVLPQTISSEVQFQAAAAPSRNFASFYAFDKEERLKPPKPVKKIKKKKKNKNQKGSAYVFDQTKFRSYNIIISPRDLQKLNSNPAAENYVPCSIVTDYGRPFAELHQGCGCRYKGSVGSLRICLDPVTGRKNDNCRKLSWKVDSNKFLPEEDKQKIMKQKKLVFNGLAVDDSLVSERLAYNMIRDSGVTAPLAAHAKLYVNKKFDGIYSLVESPDEIFTKRNFKDDENDGEGALYKDALLESTDTRYYQEHRQTDKNEDKFMAEVARAAAAATPATAASFFEKYFDSDSIVDVTAVNTLLGMTDDWRRRHNFFWYVREMKEKNYNGKKKKVKKLVMIPWDYDRINDANAETRAPKGSPPQWYDPIDFNSVHCRKMDTDALTSTFSHPRNERDFWLAFYSAMPPKLNKPINCDHFTQLMASALKERTLHRIAFLAEHIFTAANINEKVATYNKQIQSKVGAGNTIPTKDMYKNALQALKEYLAKIKRKAMLGENTNSVTATFSSSPKLTTAMRASTMQTASRASSTTTNSAFPSFMQRPSSQFGESSQFGGGMFNSVLSSPNIGGASFSQPALSFRSSNWGR